MSRTFNEPMSPCLLRVDPAGVPFYDWLQERCSGTQQVQRLAAFIQEWGVLDDEYTGDPKWGPSIETYADRFNRSTATSYRLKAEFGRVIPGEWNPGRINRLLWSGMPIWTGIGDGPFRLRSLLGIEVTEKDGAMLAEEARQAVLQERPRCIWSGVDSAEVCMGGNDFEVAHVRRIAVREDGAPADAAGWFLEIHRTGLMSLDSFDAVQFPAAPGADQLEVGEAAVEAFLQRITAALVDISTGAAPS